MSTTLINNPVLPGFHPDPSICCVTGPDGRDDFYIATSTFEWWPGVRIHHSRDLVHWRHHSHVLTRSSQLDLRGRPDSGGLWAPCLSHAHGRFWLIFTDVRNTFGAYKDCHNHVVSAERIEGPWSEPSYLNSSGFDPSLFHDDDGRSWLLNQQWTHQPGEHPFNGILLQEFDRERRCLVGPVKNIYRGTALQVVEGPHLYRRGGWYYLLTAEGGTYYEHAVTLARSRHIDGPYETLPGNPLLSAWQERTDGLHRAGHASWVQTSAGEWYMAHLCGRPLEWSAPGAPAPDTRAPLPPLHCILGRETALQRLHWREDGWPEVAGGGRVPRLRVPAPAGAALGSDSVPAPHDLPSHDDFDAAVLDPAFCTLRQPLHDSWASLRERPGHLRLRGRESLMSLFDQSLVARRQQHFHCRVQTVLDFEPEGRHQMAGLVAYYNTQHHAYLHLSREAAAGDALAPGAAPPRVLRLLLVRQGVLSEPVPPQPLPPGPVALAVHFQHLQFQFAFRPEGGAWQDFGPALDSRWLSDEAATRFAEGHALSFGFTGNFIGVACQDLAGTRAVADFDSFSYTPLVG